MNILLKFELKQSKKRDESLKRVGHSLIIAQNRSRRPPRPTEQVNDEVARAKCKTIWAAERAKDATGQLSAEQDSKSKSNNYKGDD